MYYTFEKLMVIILGHYTYEKIRVNMIARKKKQGFFETLIEYRERNNYDGGRILKS